MRPERKANGDTANRGHQQREPKSATARECVAPKGLRTQKLGCGLNGLDRTGNGDFAFPVDELPYDNQRDNQQETVEQPLQGSPLRRGRGVGRTDVCRSARFGNDAHRNITPCPFAAAAVVPK